VREYIWLPETEIAPTREANAQVDRPLAVVNAVGTASVANWNVSVDHLNRPVLMTNSLKGPVWTAVWQPWGGAHSITGTGVLDARFPGQWYQTETGLHYNWHRSYDPAVGRYTQPDPLGFVDGPSVYGYARGKPGMRVDKDGRRVVIDDVTIIVVAAGVVGTAYVWQKYCVPAISQMASKPKRRGSENPSHGTPGTSTSTDDGNGKGQIRDFGPNGRPVKDIDFGHDHTGAGDPHAHDWDWANPGPKGPRGVARPIGPQDYGVNMKTTNCLSVARVASSIQLVLQAGLLAQFQYVVITSLDSDDALSTNLIGKRIFDANAGCEFLGSAVVATGIQLADTSSKLQLFNGFDEIWCFNDKPNIPKPFSAWILPPYDIEADPFPLELATWFTKTNCRLGLGDGMGMNIVSDDANLVKMVVLLECSV
jgi:RHS repeat-associated protein